MMAEKILSVRIHAPARIDLIGGTLDIWPLSAILSPAQTINLAIEIGHHLEFQPADRWILEDVSSHEKWLPGSTKATPERFKFPWFILQHLPTPPFHVRLDSTIPRGSGLGGSSALAAGLIAGAYAAAGHRLDRRRLVQLAQFLETQFIRTPTGYQDYLASIYGGFHAWEWNAYGWKPIKLNRYYRWIKNRFLVVYLGVSHFSGRPNWEIFRAFIDGDRHTTQCFIQIRDATIKFMHALRNRNEEAMIDAIRCEMKARAALHPSILEHGVAEALSLKWPGLKAVRVCGAGGGGSMVFWIDPAAREAITRAVKQKNWEILEPVQKAGGLKINVMKSPARGAWNATA